MINNKPKKIGLVDYENFHNLEEVIKYNFDIVIIFVGSRQNKVAMPAENINAEIIKIDKGDKNSLDFVIVAECGKIFF